MTNPVTWEWVSWRARAHVARDILLYAAEEPVRASLVEGFAEDALGLANEKDRRIASDEIVSRLRDQGLLSGSAPTDSRPTSDEVAFEITEGGRAWVRRYYELLENIAVKRSAV